MPVDLDREPDFEPVFEALLQKTKEGKLDWQETAEEETFIASAKGEKTFIISTNETQYPILTVKDADGEELFETPSKGYQGSWALYNAAKRLATRVDEKIESALEMINEL